MHNTVYCKVNEMLMNNGTGTDAEDSVYSNQVNLLAWAFVENQNESVMTERAGITEIHVTF
jgi:hypothetical protein